GRWWKGGIPGLRLPERSFSRIRQDCGRPPPARDHKIDGSVVVQIRGERTDRGLAVSAQTGLNCPVCECSIAIVAPECIQLGNATRKRKIEFSIRLNGEIGEPGYIKVEIAIVVKIHER